jgi:hypothetical protein
VQAERPSRTLRRTPEAPSPDDPVVPVVAEAVASAADVAGEVAAPRRRGRPRKIVDTATVEG